MGATMPALEEIAALRREAEILLAEAPFGDAGDSPSPERLPLGDTVRSEMRVETRMMEEALAAMIAESFAPDGPVAQACTAIIENMAEGAHLFVQESSSRKEFILASHVIDALETRIRQGIRFTLAHCDAKFIAHFSMQDPQRLVNSPCIHRVHETLSEMPGSSRERINEAVTLAETVLADAEPGALWTRMAERLYEPKDREPHFLAAGDSQPSTRMKIAVEATLDEHLADFRTRILPAQDETGGWRHGRRHRISVISLLEAATRMPVKIMGLVGMAVVLVSLDPRARSQGLMVPAQFLEYSNLIAGALISAVYVMLARSSSDERQQAVIAAKTALRQEVRRMLDEIAREIQSRYKTASAELGTIAEAWVLQAIKLAENDREADHKRIEHRRRDAQRAVREAERRRRREYAQALRSQNAVKLP